MRSARRRQHGSCTNSLKKPDFLWMHSSQRQSRSTQPAGRRVSTSTPTHHHGGHHVSLASRATGGSSVQLRLRFQGHPRSRCAHCTLCGPREQYVSASIFCWAVAAPQAPVPRAMWHTSFTVIGRVNGTIHRFWCWCVQASRWLRLGSPCSGTACSSPASACCSSAAMRALQGSGSPAWRSRRARPSSRSSCALPSGRLSHRATAW